MFGEGYGKDIVYKGIKFEIRLRNQNEAIVRAVYYPICTKVSYYLDKPIISYIHEAIDNLNIEKIIERLDEFYN